MTTIKQPTISAQKIKALAIKNGISYIPNSWRGFDYSGITLKSKTSSRYCNFIHLYIGGSKHEEILEQMKSILAETGHELIEASNSWNNYWHVSRKVEVNA